jgi:hypothetical protein
MLYPKNSIIHKYRPEHQKSHTPYVTDRAGTLYDTGAVASERVSFLLESQGCGVGTQKLRLRLLHKSSICINNGKPVRHFITNT